MILSKHELVEIIKELDQDPDVEVTDWEAKFMESILSMNHPEMMSVKQEDVCNKITEKYWR